MSEEIVEVKGVKISDLEEATTAGNLDYLIINQDGETKKIQRGKVKAQKISELRDDVGYLTQIPSEYMTESEVKEFTDAEIAKIREVLNTWTQFKNSGGEVGGCLSFKKKVRQIQQELDMRDRTYSQRQNLSNYNGYPTWATVIEDPNDDTNTNGMLFMLGTGVEGDSYRDNYFRPLKMGYTQRNYIGSQSVPWDDIYLRGNSKNDNGYTKLPNGLIMQWATLNLPPTDETSIYLPISFPNKILSMYATPRGNRANGAWSIPWWDNRTIKVWNGSNIEINYYVLAIGY